MRESRCRAGLEDCYSTNRWRGYRPHTPGRNRQAEKTANPTSSPVWKWIPKKLNTKEVKKKVSFADPLVQVMETPKTVPGDDSVLLAKDVITAECILDRETGLEPEDILATPNNSREQHFTSPLTKDQAEAIKLLVEEGNQKVVAALSSKNKKKGVDT